MRWVYRLFCPSFLILGLAPTSVVVASIGVSLWTGVLTYELFTPPLTVLWWVAAYGLLRRKRNAARFALVPTVLLWAIAALQLVTYIAFEGRFDAGLAILLCLLVPPTLVVILGMLAWQQERSIDACECDDVSDDEHAPSNSRIAATKRRTYGPEESMKTVRNLRIAAVALVISLILYYPVLALGIAKKISEGTFVDAVDDVPFSLPSSLVVLFHIMNIAAIILNVLWVRGFVLIGKNFKNRLLLISSYLLLIAVTIWSVMPWIPTPADMVVGSQIPRFHGLVSVCFGIGILRLQDKFGGAAKAYGVLSLIEGAFLLLYFLPPLIWILVMPKYVFGTLVLFRVSKDLELYVVSEPKVLRVTDS